MNEQATKAVRLAIENDDFVGLLRGGWPYSIDFPYMSPALLPTDYDALFEALKAVAEEHPDLPSMLRDAMLEMTRAPEDAYLLMYVLYSALWSERQEGWSLGALEVAEALSAVLPQYKQALSQDRRLGGRDMPNGKWDDVLRVSSVLKQRHGVSVAG